MTLELGCWIGGFGREFLNWEVVLKYKCLGSTAGVLEQMPWRCGTQCFYVETSPQGGSDAHISSGAIVVYRGRAKEECLFCGSERGLSRVWGTCTRLA